MKSKIIPLLIVTLSLTISSCGQKESKKEQVLSVEEYKEEDYYKVQGIVIKRNIRFDYINKFNKRDVHYIYYLDLKEPLLGVEKNIQSTLDVEEPIAVMVHKKDSTKSFIGHRGIINEELLVEYLTRPDNNYEEWLKKE